MLTIHITYYDHLYNMVIIISIHIGDRIIDIPDEEFNKEYCSFNATKENQCVNYLNFVRNMGGKNRCYLCYVCKFFNIEKLRFDVPRELIRQTKLELSGSP